MMKPRRGRGFSVVKGRDTVKLGAEAVAIGDVLSDLKLAQQALLRLTAAGRLTVDANMSSIELDAVMAAHYALKVAIAHLQKRDPWGDK